MKTSAVNKAPWAIMTLLLLLLASPLFDQPIVIFLHTIGEGGLDHILALVCSWPFYVVLFIGPLFWAQAGRRNVYAKALVLAIVTYMATFFLKEIFHVARPFVVSGWTPLESFADYGFPSSHAATVFALLPLAREYGTRFQWKVWLTFALLIVFSRVTLGMHFPSDVLSGSLLGLSFGHVAVHFERFFTRKGTLAEDGNELLRQALHVIVGIGIVILVHASLVTPWMLLASAIIGGVFLLLDKRFHFRFLHRAISAIERQKDISSFPGRGSVFYLVGSWLVLVLFPTKIALASILVLAFGDGFASLVGRFFGVTKVGYNPPKTWEGTMAGILAATVAAGWFVPWWLALLSATVAMLVETFPLRIGKFSLDDNLILPFIAATVISLASQTILWVSG